MRTHKTHALFHIFLLGLLSTMSTAVPAAERDGLFELYTVKNHDGLVTAEPRISQQELNDVLVENKYLINVRRHKLEVFIEENRITANTGIMAAIMPGGLIYLALRKANLHEANVELENLQTDMNDLQSDIFALHVEEGPVLVARFP